MPEVTSGVLVVNAEPQAAIVARTPPRPPICATTSAAHPATRDDGVTG
jgi:hypothetical protein